MSRTIEDLTREELVRLVEAQQEVIHTGNVSWVADLCVRGAAQATLKREVERDARAAKRRFLSAVGRLTKLRAELGL